MADLRLPPPLASAARFQALGQIASRLNALALTPVLVYLIDTVDASALPHLADQFRVLGEGWQFARDDGERRALIKRAIEIKRHRGTPWAIDQVLAILKLSGELQEWFQYGGKAYHFKVNVNLAERGIDEATYAALVALIAKYKNVRSTLESLSVMSIVRAPVPLMAAVTLAGEVTTIYPKMPADMVLASPHYVAAGIQFVETTTIYPRNTACVQNRSITP